MLYEVITVALDQLIGAVPVGIQHGFDVSECIQDLLRFIGKILQIRQFG